MSGEVCRYLGVVGSNLMTEVRRCGETGSLWMAYARVELDSIVMLRYIIKTSDDGRRARQMHIQNVFFTAAVSKSGTNRPTRQIEVYGDWSFRSLWLAHVERLF